MNRAWPLPFPPLVPLFRCVAMTDAVSKCILLFNYTLARRHPLLPPPSFHPPFPLARRRQTAKGSPTFCSQTDSIRPNLQPGRISWAGWCGGFFDSFLLFIFFLSRLLLPAYSLPSRSLLPILILPWFSILFLTFPFASNPSPYLSTTIFLHHLTDCIATHFRIRVISPAHFVPGRLIPFLDFLVSIVILESPDHRDRHSEP